MAEGFLTRWSQRKREAVAGKAPAESPSGAPPEVLAQALSPGPASTPTPALQAAPEATPAPVQAAPPPVMADVQALTSESDFSPFVARGVAPEVRNAAMKKLFADPRFNVMDGLDTYIDDYSKPDPIPESMMRQLASSKFLKLFDAEPRDAEHGDVANSPNTQSVAQSQAPSLAADAGAGAPTTEPHLATPGTEHANSDLRLQQDDATGSRNARGGAQ